MLSWNDLSLPQQCVMVGTIEEVNLSDLLYDWSPKWADEDIQVLGDAVVELNRLRLIEVSFSSAEPALTDAAVRDVVANLGAWVPGEDDALQVVGWLSTTDAGDRVVETAERATMYAYRGRPGRNP
jgi:hypothetical protein